MKIVTVKQMLELEQRSADAGAPPHVLMENAGLATATKAVEFLGKAVGQSILILIGPGNNGGDGLVAARHLHDWGANVHLHIFKRKTGNDKNFALDMERGIAYTNASDDNDLSILKNVLSSAGMVIDALFGTGKIRPLEGLAKDILQCVGAAKGLNPGLKIMAIDLPSGLDADSGTIDPACLTCDMTITLGYPKVGLFKFPGATKTGKIEIADIGIPADLGKHISLELITPGNVQFVLPPRPIDANKGTFGKLLVVAGSTNYIGAASLACLGALRVGAGLVTLATPRCIQPILAGMMMEITYLPLPESDEGCIGKDAAQIVQQKLADYDALLIGCGLGQNPDTAEFVKEVLFSNPLTIPTVVDADGLNILSKTSQWWEQVSGQLILTPHPGEMSRLTGQSVAEIQVDRLRAALAASTKWNQTVVLKGAHTVVASPQGEARISGIANPGLASAGTGDVLAGAIAGNLAQGISPLNAAICGVYLHSQAGELVKDEIGIAGTIASDLLPRLPIAIRNARA